MNLSLVEPFSDDVSRGQDIPAAVSRRKRLSLCVAAAVVGVSLVSVHDVNAAPKKSAKKSQSTKAVSDLEAENALLKAQLEAVQHERDSLKQAGAAGAVAPAAGEPSLAEPTAATAEPTETVAEQQAAETDNLGEVVVKARPKLAKLHDVAQSVSVVTGQELSRELSLDLGAITRRASNVQFNQNNTRGASLSIRGLGKRSFSETQDPSVGVTVDGVSYGLSQLANFSFYDVESVEVTRGPRGTEGGLSASSGKVNVKSKAPTFTPTAELSATYGEREALILQGAMGGGIIDDVLAFRTSFIVDKGRGFYTQEHDSNYSLYNKDRLSGRAQLLFTPTSTITAKLTADFEPEQPQLQNGLTFYHDSPYKFANGNLVDPTGTQARAKLAGFYARTTDPITGKENGISSTFTPGRDYFQNRGFSYNDYIGGQARGTVWFNENQGQTVSNQGGSINVDWDLDSHVLSSNTGVREYSFDAHNDEGTPFDISVDGGGGVQYRQWTQELKIANKPGGFADYKAGVFAIKTWDDIDGKTGWGSDAGAWFATNGQYNALAGSTINNPGPGRAILKDVLADARVKERTSVGTQSGALFGETDLHFTDQFTLTSGLRTTLEDRSTSNERLIANNGIGAAFNPDKVRGINTGGFASDTRATLPAPTAQNPTATITNPDYGKLLPGNSVQQLQLADSIAKRYYGVNAGANPGDAYNTLVSDSAKRIQVANAKTIRQNQLGRLNNAVEGDYDDLLFTAQLTPSYKFNEDLTGYLSWQYGEKSGSVIATNGIAQKVKPENTHALELGLKSFWVDKSVIFNADAYVMDIHNYQQSVLVIDEFATQTNIANGTPNPTTYVAAQGNVKKARVYGIEIDNVINTIPNLSIRLNGAWNIAKYIDYKNAAKPPELAFLSQPFIDQSGQRLPGASEWSFNVGAEYTRPVFDKFNFHTSFNTNFQSKFNNADDLSNTGWLDDRARTDASVGIGTKNKIWDLSLIGKNIFNDTRHEQGWVSYAPDPYPRWFGIQVSGKI
ncbi:MAG: TonB-dependent receptor [Methylococcaceae bacterium]|nr:TonB-dependent receptor [Methylococcaceae bacterium]